jgi:hypothetical protein
MKYSNCPMSSSLFSCFQENTKCESSFFADTCTCRVPIFCVELVLPHRNWQIQMVFIILLTKIYGILGIKNPDS